MIKKIILALSLLLSAAASATAQFADQATYAGAGGGTANAQTLTLANASSYADLVGVIIKYIPTATNSGPATLNVNGFGSSPAFRKPTGSGVGALTGGEIVAAQPTYVMYDGTYFQIVAPTLLPVGASSIQNSALSFEVPVNLQLNASVLTNSLTIAIKGNDGNDPSASNPVLIPFRDSTIANGGPKVVSLQSALSFTIASGSTMGCVSGQMCRLWITAICVTGLECTNSAGSDTLALCAYNAKSGTNIVGIQESQLQTSASGTSGGNSAQTLYCGSSSVTARAIRILGYIDIQEVTAGTWAVGPTLVQLFGPGIKKAGDVVQRITPSAITTSTNLQNSETQTSISASIALTSAANLVEASSSAQVTVTSAHSAIIYLSRGTAPTLIGNTAVLGGGSTPTTSYSLSVTANDNPNTTSTTTYYVYGRSDANNAAIVNGDVNSSSVIKVFEIMGSLEPANDDNDRIKKIG